MNPKPKDTRNPLGDAKPVYTNPALTDPNRGYSAGRATVKELAQLVTRCEHLHVNIRRWHATCYHAQVVNVENGAWLYTGEGSTADNALWAVVNKLIDQLKAPVG